MIFNGFPIRDPYEFELEQVIKHVSDCCKIMIDSGNKLPNDENEIRNNLVEGYLANSSIMKKVGITDYLFTSEVGVFRDSDFRQVGRSDIKVALYSSSFIEPKKQFIIECKRLDGGSDLNREYVKEGVCRFISELYPTFLNMNSMVGFCISKFDIHDNATKNINAHLNKWCSKETINTISNELFIENFDYTYSSLHKTSISNQEFKLYHLMLDVTSILN